MMRRSLSFYAIRTALAVVAAGIITLLSHSGYFVEQIYVKTLYPYISGFLRMVTGWTKFSLGDCLYVIVFISVLVTLIRTVIFLVKEGITWQKSAAGGLYVVRKLANLYIVFMVLWGLNYSREGIASEMKLASKEYTTDELKALVNELVERVNATRRVLGDSVRYPSSDTLYAQAVRAYGAVALQYSFLDYRHASIKTSTFSTPLTYLGYTGYYNPFSGEAQVNTTVPPYYIPFIACHEMAHQLGYGDESEANFIGFLSARASDQPVFHYSAYYDLFNYANGELFSRDSVAARSNYRLLDTLVKTDIRNARRFFSRYKSRMEPVVKFLYGEYLKANNMPQGIDTYEAVTAWLIAYRKKYGPL
ncbi:hypothetical protein HNQ91_001199 [Filimonas zeae]|uniref:DUF3810 domain-containing protein n=1 Tax=Filimonas zeae TaxID=1737353 RepID=A0A917IRB5_9BACT|nr:DUF3810 domain-containing protein [Filimonas zeae]MDR6338177.1 hypothetical protein [Filimonas zeae]GGH62098.1 hypothetical protein GCM10011379_11730 [Filimonas zeae]